MLTTIAILGLVFVIIISLKEFFKIQITTEKLKTPKINKKVA